MMFRLIEVRRNSGPTRSSLIGTLRIFRAEAAAHWQDAVAAA
jgi:hypothetical protein